ncbi:MAG: hypothetical protein ACM3SX_10755, partial [Deltaproteobacteria bacterium]
MSRHTAFRLAFICACALAPSAPLAAQQTLGSGAASTTAKGDPGAKKILGLADIARWKRINGAALSADGAWMTYAYQP